MAHFWCMKGIGLLLLLAPFCLGAQKAAQLLDPFVLHEVKVNIEDPYWEARLTKYKKDGRKDEIPCTVWLDGVRVDSVGIRFKGNSSYNSLQGQGRRKLPFSLDADAFRKGARFPSGIAELKLANGFRDPSMMREVLAYYIARAYMPAPRSAFAKLVINDEYFGVYSLTEDIDRSFLDRWFMESKGVLYKCDPDWSAPRDTTCPISDKANLEYVGEDPACYRPFYELQFGKDWSTLITLARRLGENDPPLDSILDVDRTLWMHAFNNVLVNLDSYSGRLCHNYFLYRDRVGRSIPLVWDMNLAFGGFRMAGTDNLSDVDMITLDPSLHQNELRRPLISKLLADSLNHKVYLDHIHTILVDFFQNEKYKDLMKTWSSLIESAVAQEIWSLYGLEAFQQNASASVLAGKVPIIGIQELMDQRVKFLLSHPDLVTPRPFCKQNKAYRVKNRFQIDSYWSQVERVHLFWRYKGEVAFKKMPFVSTKTKGVGGTILYRALVPWRKGGIEYYLIGENRSSATCHPKVSSHKPFKAV